MMWSREALAQALGCPRGCRHSRCRLVGFGNQVPRQSRRNFTRGDRSSGPPRSVGGVAESNRANRRNSSCRETCNRSSLHPFTPARMLSEEVVFRYWSARQARTAPGLDRNAGSRSATPASSQQSVTAQANLELASITKTRYQGL